MELYKFCPFSDHISIVRYHIQIVRNHIQIVSKQTYRQKGLTCPVLPSQSDQADSIQSPLRMPGAVE